MKCTICGKPIVLVPSAEARAAADVSGRSASYYRSLFRQHDACLLEKREQETLELMRKINGSIPTSGRK